MFEEQFVSAAEAGRRTGQSERTIRRWIERGKLQATKHGSTFQIALADLDQFVASRTPDVHTLLARVLALEDLADVQASQAQRLFLLVTHLPHPGYCCHFPARVRCAHWPWLAHPDPAQPSLFFFIESRFFHSLSPLSSRRSPGPSTPSVPSPLHGVS